jgi:glycosyltransferase involved in cell wall biosynthesis
MDRARVTIFLPSLDGGGAERSIVAVANGLAERGAEVALALGSARGPYLADVSPGIETIDLGSADVLRALPRLVRHLRAYRPAAVLSAMSHANIAAALAHRLSGSRAKLVLSERVNLSSLFEASRDLRTRLSRPLMRLTYPWADQVVTVSDGVADDLMRHIPLLRERVATIYNPVVDDRLLAKAAARPAHPWLLSQEQPVILAAGRLVPQKDFATLIRAFAQLRRQRPARLLILGEGEQRDALLALAAECGVADDVALPGFDTNPFAAMRAAAVFVLSSRYEGLPGVLIQAMACGARVVSTDCPSGPREVLEDGRWGMLVPVGDAAALASAMADTLDDPRPPDVRARAAAFSQAQAVDRYAHALGLGG